MASLSLESHRPHGCGRAQGTPWPFRCPDPSERPAPPEKGGTGRSRSEPLRRSPDPPEVLSEPRAGATSRAAVTPQRRISSAQMS